MSISTYKRWMKESYLYEADDDKVIGKDDKGDPVTVRQALDSSSDNPTMVKLKKKAQDLSDKDKGGEEEPKAEPKKTAISKTGGFGGDTGTDADFQGDPPEGTREPDDTAGDPEDAWDDEEGRAKPTGKTDADAWEDDPVGGDDVDDEEPEDDEPEKPEREPVKVKYDTGSQDKGNVWKGASGRFAAAHGYSGEKTGFDDPMAATAWASGLYDTPEDAIASIYEAKKEIIKVINGKKYKPIKESVNKRIAVKEVYKWLNENDQSWAKYYSWRNDKSMTPKQKIGMSMREVRDSLQELERIVNRSIKLKKELKVGSDNYWKSTHSALRRIHERLVKLTGKIANLY